MLNGSKGEATRTGDKYSGMHTIAASWEGSVRVDLYTRYENGKSRDYASIYLEPWHGEGKRKVIAVGIPVDGKPRPRGTGSVLRDKS